jgi:GTP-binding protein EngB required for normal cell division/uncharacterized protein (DUF697 family)
MLIKLKVDPLKARNIMDETSASISGSVLATQPSREKEEFERLKEEVTEIQNELKIALNQMLFNVGGKLPSSDRGEIEKEFIELDELLSRVKTGYVWLALFGKTSVGKSAIANSLIGADVAKTGVEHDLTASPHPYEKDRWKIVDVPGILGQEINEQVALAEANKAHGHIFVIDSEPYSDEMELFDLVAKNSPKTPKIVFFNKADLLEPPVNTTRNKEIIKRQVAQKMGKYVADPSEIIYGNAIRILDDEEVRQDLPQLMNKIYEGAGSLSVITGILDPAGRAHSLTINVRERLFAARSRICRKVIMGFAMADAGLGWVPFHVLLVTPGILASMVYALSRVLGQEAITKIESVKIAKDLLGACTKVLGLEFAAQVAGEIVVNTITAGLGPIMWLMGTAGSGAALTWYRYRRAAIFGEVALEYLRLNRDWGAEGPAAVIQRCKERALEHYGSVRNARRTMQLEDPLAASAAPTG